jgi:hypothetical protein
MLLKKQDSMCTSSIRCRSWSSASSAPGTSGQVCRFFVQNKCLRGDSCPFSHDLTVEADADPSDDMSLSIENHSGAGAATCGICLQSVLAEGRRFGLLPNCAHVFCLDCIKAWRNKSRCRKCPMCRISSLFVIPSYRFYSGLDTKRCRVVEYLRFLGERPCIYYSATHLCPYGQLCFFKHSDPTEDVCSFEAKVRLVYADETGPIWQSVLIKAALI